VSSSNHYDYDVIVLDLMLPSMDGLTVLRRLREMGKQTHVLILSAKDQVEDRIRGLRLGADDYLVKPFSFDELCARLEALVRRKHGEKNPEIAIGGLLLNTAMHAVSRDGQALNLTPAEHSIFERLALSRGRILSKKAGGSKQASCFHLTSAHEAPTYAHLPAAPASR
jgi:DNA-binding response OmpR family regulator